MLAKELKIKNLKKQREFIKRQISTFAGIRNDGDSSYIYVGYVYPEVIKYFQSEGFIVTKIESEKLTAVNKGMPTYLFVPGAVELTEDELRVAEAIGIEENGDDSPEDFNEFMASLLGELGIG